MNTCKCGCGQIPKKKGSYRPRTEILIKEKKMPSFDVIGLPQIDSYYTATMMAQTTCPQQMQDVWPIKINGDQLTIGCKSYSIMKWGQMTDKEISDMHPNALAWWKKVKTPLFKLLEALGKCYYVESDKWQDDWM